MRVFVLGASGVIGRRAIPLLLADGHSVTALARKPVASASDDGPRFVAADIFDADALKRAVAGHDAIINLATHMPSSTLKMLFRSAWRANDRIRSEGVANVVDAALACGIRTIVQESFALTYPDCDERWIDEESTLDPSDYNRTVVDAEHSIARFASSGAKGVVLRFAAFYGPDAIQLASYIRALRMGWAALPGGANRYVSSVSHDDAAAAVVAALNVPGGTYNVADDEPVTRGVYFGSLATSLNLAPPRFLPAWVTPLFGSVGEAMARSLRLSNRKLRRASTWSPRFPSVREGWHATLAQMKGV